MSEELRELVAQRIKRLRMQAGRSLREQARRTGIAPSALSQLENQRGGLSLERLQRVAADFGLHVTDLLSDPNGRVHPNGEPPVELFRDCVASASGLTRGEGAWYQLIGAGHGHQLQPYLISFTPGGGYDGDLMAHPGEEFSYVVLGTVDVLIGDASHRLRSGDGIRFRADQPHGFRNASADGMAMIVGAATPPW
jgi:transcriptional regulator with XRE-family HTH domain/mannose-6-phosphate isomerase-like protein (cupin superfamily)